MAVLAPAARGQEVPLDPAVSVAASIEARYGALRSLRARFEQRYVHRLHARETRSRGTLFLQRPDRFALVYTDPRGRAAVGDAERVRSFDPDPAPGQLFETRRGDSSLPIGLGLMQGDASLRTEHDLRLIDASASGFVGAVLEARPKRPEPTYERVLLYVDRSAERAGRVHRLLIVDPAGNTNRFDLLDQRENVAIPASTFVLTAPGAVVIEN